jgi:hypothetical protein
MKDEHERQAKVIDLLDRLMTIDKIHDHYDRNASGQAYYDVFWEGEYRRDRRYHTQTMVKEERNRVIRQLEAIVDLSRNVEMAKRQQMARRQRI